MSKDRMSREQMMDELTIRLEALQELLVEWGYLAPAEGATDLPTRRWRWRKRSGGYAISVGGVGGIDEVLLRDASIAIRCQVAGLLPEIITAIREATEQADERLVLALEQVTEAIGGLTDDD